jgi:hypothetical protein
MIWGEEVEAGKGEEVGVGKGEEVGVGRGGQAASDTASKHS